MGYKDYVPLDMHAELNSENVVVGVTVSSAAILCFLLQHSSLQIPPFLPLL